MRSPTDQVAREARRITRKDIAAGITNAVTNIPDAMANAVLAGLNPIQGLYSIMIGTPVGSLATGSQLMTVAVTGAMALIVGDSLAAIPASNRVGPLIALTLLVGIVQIGLGLAKAGGLLRFVSNSVLRGFLLGVAVNIVLSQIPEVTGYSSAFHNKVVRLVDTVLHPMRFDLRVVAVALLTVGVVLLVERTRARDFAFLCGLVVSAGAAALLGWHVPTVRELGGIPRSLPTLTLPKFSDALGMLVPALSIAVVGLIQSAGVSKSVPNRDGRYPSMNHDFVGQGIANAATSVFGGMPVGGSVSSTALVAQMGAKSRIANFMVGPLIALVVLFLSGAVEMIPLATLGALLIIVGVRAVNLPAVETVWQTSVPSRAIMGVTFIAMLLVPVQFAVLLGVALSFIQHVYSASLDVRVVALGLKPDGFLAEEPTPETLPDHAVTILDIYGSVFYAGADVIEKLLPTATGSKEAVAILRLRGRTDVGSTFLTMLHRYHHDIAAGGGRLMLTGVGPDLLGQLERTGMLEVLGAENVFEAHRTLTESTAEAVRAAEAWLSESEGGAAE